MVQSCHCNQPVWDFDKTTHISFLRNAHVKLSPGRSDVRPRRVLKQAAITAPLGYGHIQNLKERASSTAPSKTTKLGSALISDLHALLPVLP